MYINGEPYCLRRENFSIRNMKVSSLVPNHEETENNLVL